MSDLCTAYVLEGQAYRHNKCSDAKVSVCVCLCTSICTSIGSAPKPRDASNLANAYAFLVDTDVSREAGATFR